jgi:hypothetical protein
MRVPLPSSLSAERPLRVVAVSGVQRNGLASPLGARLVDGPASFGGHSLFGGAVSLLGGSPGALPSPSGKSGDEATGAPAVARADVWAVRGARIYFFNQLRGLQIIDVSDRQNPSLSGSLSLPAVGEDMYLLGGDSDAARSAVLVARAPWRPDQPEFTRVLRIGVESDSPALDSEMEIPGYLVESRLAGNIKPVKPGGDARGTRRIDGVVAAVTALSRLMVAPEAKRSVYAERGVTVIRW